MLTGTRIDVFLDRTDITWGQEWRRRINEGLEGTLFFIPVISPRYFQSDECRKELLTFAAHAESLGVRELLLPLVYVPVPDLSSDDPSDEAVALVARTQYVDWTELRLEDQDSPAYRRAVNALAARLVGIAHDASVTSSALQPFDASVMRRARASATTVSQESLTRSQLWRRRFHTGLRL